MKHINHTGEVFDNDPTVTVQKAACSTEPSGDLHNAFPSFRLPVRIRITGQGMWRKQDSSGIFLLKLKAASNRQILK